MLPAAAVQSTAPWRGIGVFSLTTGVTVVILAQVCPEALVSFIATGHEHLGASPPRASEV
jgi:hypothetical protein